MALKRLRNDNNTSDIPGGMLQRNNIHMAVSEASTVGDTLTAQNKADLYAPETIAENLRHAHERNGGVSWLVIAWISRIG